MKPFNTILLFLVFTCASHAQSNETYRSALRFSLGSPMNKANHSHYSLSATALRISPANTHAYRLGLSFHKNPVNRYFDTDGNWLLVQHPVSLSEDQIIFQDIKASSYEMELRAGWQENFTLGKLNLFAGVDFLMGLRHQNLESRERYFDYSLNEETGLLMAPFTKTSQIVLSQDSWNSLKAGFVGVLGAEFPISHSIQFNCQWSPKVVWLSSALRHDPIILASARQIAQIRPTRLEVGFTFSL